MWGKEESTLLAQVSLGADELWGLTNTGAVQFRPTAGGINNNDWTALASICAHEPNRGLSFRAFSAGATTLQPVPAASRTKSTILGNGCWVVSSKLTTHGVAMQELLNARDASVAAALGHRHYDKFVAYPEMGSRVVAMFPQEAAGKGVPGWYRGRCVGARGQLHPPKEGCGEFLLVRFENGLHLWCDRAAVAPDEPPPESLLHVGSRVLYSTDDWRGNVGFAHGYIADIIVEQVPSSPADRSEVSGPPDTGVESGTTGSADELTDPPGMNQ